MVFCCVWPFQTSGDCPRWSRCQICLRLQTVREITYSADFSINSFCLISHPSIKVKRARHDESTSNLVRHADACDPDESTSRTITSFAHGSTYSAPKLRVKLALWVVRRNRPFSIVEDPEFIEILTDLNNKVTISSRVTLSNDVKEIFKISQERVASLLQVCPYHLRKFPQSDLLHFLGIFGETSHLR
jgi:hypothetical protein